MSGEPDYPLSDGILVGGFVYEPTESTVRFPVAVGLGKQRNKYTTMPWKMVGTIIVDLADKNILDAFIKDDLRTGADPFRKVDPIDSERTWLWRFQEPQAYTPIGAGNFTTTLSLMRIPKTMIYIGPEYMLSDAAGNQLTDEFDEDLRS